MERQRRGPLDEDRPERLVIAAAAVAIIAVIAGVYIWRDQAAGSEAPSNVHIVQSDVTGEQWIRWDDNSGDEAGFRGSVRLLRDGDVIAVSDFNTPPPGEAQSPVTPFDTRFVDDGACYDARINVEAVMRDGSTFPAEEATVQVCIDNGFARYTPFIYTPEPLSFPEPPPGLVRGNVEVSPTGDYSLSLEGSTAADVVLTTTRVYSESGALVHERNMPTVPGGTSSLDVDAAEGLAAPDPQSIAGGAPPGVYDGCYRRDFITWTIIDGALGGWSAVSRLPVCYGDVVSNFPTIDHPEPIIPGSASNVGIVRDSGGNWTITWDDNSDNETGFEILVSVLELDGQTFVRSAATSRAEGYTTAGLPLDLALLAQRCYRTTIYVFSERFDNASGFPGNAVYRMCAGDGDATFEPWHD